MYTRRMKRSLFLLMMVCLTIAAGIVCRSGFSAQGAEERGDGSAQHVLAGK